MAFQRDPTTSVAVWWRRASLALGGASLLWTVVEMFSGSLRPRLDIAHFAGIGSLLVLSETAFVMGLALIATATGRTLGRNLRSLTALRSESKTILQAVGRQRLTRVGLYLNWTGAAGTAIVLIGAVIVILPPASWGLAIIPALDLASTFALRMPIRSALARIGSV